MPGVSDVAVKVGLDATQMSRGAKAAANDIKGIEKSVDPTSMSLRKMRREGRAVFEATRTPLEQYQREMAKLNTLHRKGVINADTHARAIRQLNTRFKSGSGVAGKFFTLARGGMVKLAAAATAGLSVAAVVNKIGQAFSDVDAIAKASDRLGVSTERLVAMRHAAELTGAGADRLSAGLETMAKRLGEAVRGAGAARPALEALGLSADKLIAMSADEAFLEIADAIRQIPEPARRAALTANIFSRSNQSLVNTLMQGREGLEKIRAEVEATGQAFGRVDAAKVEQANDAITNMSGAITGLSRTAAIHLSPIVEDFSRITQEAIELEGKLNIVQDSIRGVRLGMIMAEAGGKGGVAMLKGDWMGAFEAFQDYRKAVAEWQMDYLGEDLSRFLERGGVDWLGGGAARGGRAIADLGLDQQAAERATEAQRERARAAEAAADAVASFERSARLQIQASTEATSAHQQKLDKLLATKFSDDPFGAKEAREKLQPIVDQLEDIDRRARDASAGDALRQRLATPVEDATQRLREYQRLLSVGAIGLQTAKRASAQVMVQEIERAGDVSGPSLKQKGSQAAAEAALRHEMGGTRRETEVQRLGQIYRVLERIAQHTNPNNQGVGAGPQIEPYPNR